MSFRPHGSRTILAAALGLAALGFGLSPALQNEVRVIHRPDPEAMTVRREISKRAKLGRTGNPLYRGVRGDPGIRRKHTSRTKSRKRARCKAKRRSHRS